MRLPMYVRIVIVALIPLQLLGLWILCNWPKPSDEKLDEINRRRIQRQEKKRARHPEKYISRTQLRKARELQERVLNANNNREGERV